MVQVRSSEHSFVSEFEALQARDQASAPDWLQSLRRDALREFETLGFPTTRDEDWKYTNVAPLARQRFTLARSGDYADSSISSLGVPQLRFVGGKCVPDTGSNQDSTGPFEIMALARALGASPHATKVHLAPNPSHVANGFVSLNRAFIEDGGFIRVPAGVNSSNPVLLSFLAEQAPTPSMSHPHNLILIEKGATATVLEHYASGDGVCLTNAVTNIVLEEGARLAWYKVQEEGPEAFHIGTTNVTLGRDSAFTSFTLDLGARIARNDLSVTLEGEGAECTMNGLYVASGNSHIDNHTSVDHTGSFTPSRQLYKGVLTDNARAVFNGKIIARRGTHQVDAHQTNNNLLLSDRAMVDTKPQLEIFADDLKCSHGATVGQLDEEAIFYLASRGIGPAQSRRILTYGFAEAVLALAPDTRIREYMSGLVREKLTRPRPIRRLRGRRMSPDNTSPIDDAEATRLRSQFPAINQEVRGKPLVYLDNAATSQKPQAVIDAISDYYARYNANVHRGLHALSEMATAEYEGARAKVRSFINASDDREIIFVRGTTDGINLVAGSYGPANVGPGDEIVISEMEHHSNIVPWQILCQQTGAELKVVPFNEDGELLIDEYERILGSRTKLVAMAHTSNALGTINPVKTIVDMAHARDIPVLIDGAQAVPHGPVDMQDLDCDFFTFSSHKVFGPTGMGVLYGKAELLEAMPPYQGGGDMIKSVTFEKTIYNDLPYKFEAGTPNIAGAIGLGAAIDYVESVGMARIFNYEKRPPALRPRRPLFHRKSPYSRHRPGQGRRSLIPSGRHPCPRCRHHPGHRGHCHPHRPPLRPARHAAFRHTGHRQGFPGVLQYQVGYRRPRQGPGQSYRGLQPMSELSDLYQQAVLDHNNRPRNFGRLQNANGSAHGYNPLCGDMINVEVLMEGDTVREVGFQGEGCAISKASASMMTELVKGLDRKATEELLETFHQSVTGEINMDMMEAIDKLGKLAALSGVSEFPMRVKCATLPWHTLKAALLGEGERVTTE